MLDPLVLYEADAFHIYIYIYIYIYSVAANLLIRLSCQPSKGDAGTRGLYVRLTTPPVEAALLRTLMLDTF